MTEKEATERCEELAYELAKAADKICEIRESIDFLAKEMQWNDMLVLDFDEAIAKLCKAVSGTTTWALEARFRDSEIERLRKQADALENCEREAEEADE